MANALMMNRNSSSKWGGYDYSLVGRSVVKFTLFARLAVALGRWSSCLVLFARGPTSHACACWSLCVGDWGPGCIPIETALPKVTGERKGEKRSHHTFVVVSLSGSRAEQVVSLSVSLCPSVCWMLDQTHRHRHTHTRLFVFCGTRHKKKWIAVSRPTAGPAVSGSGVDGDGA